MSSLFNYDSVKLYDGGVYLVDGKEIVSANESEKLSSLVENVPTKEEASAMCSKWKDASQQIYSFAMKSLMR